MMQAHARAAAQAAVAASARDAEALAALQRELAHERALRTQAQARRSNRALRRSCVTD
jgi:hypothetical protein